MKQNLNHVLGLMKRHYWVSLSVIVAFLVAFVFFFLVLQSPDFPDSVPSYEKVREAEAREQAQQGLFTRFTKYLRDNHGGIIFTDEKTGYEALYLDKKPLIKTYVQRFNSLEKQKLRSLVQTFSEEEKVEIVFKTACAYPVDDLSCVQLDFSKDQLPWIRVQLEFPEDNTTSLDPNAGESELTHSRLVPFDTEQDHTEPMLAIVIDDCGYRMDVFYDLVSLDYQITFSVLPQLTYSEESSMVARRSGRDVMLHLPMQPKDWPEFDPGLGALMIHDSSETLEMKLAINLQTVPDVLGVNNHMGSAFTTHSDGLDVVMAYLSERALFFLDSKTAPGDTAKKSANKHGVTYLSRDVFLDNTQTVEATKQQLFKAGKLAVRTGKVIAIGHLYPSTFQALAEGLPELERRGISIVGISAFAGQTHIDSELVANNHDKNGEI